MRNLLNKKLKNEKGLTLIELLAVIVILAIIALIAIPAIGSIVSNSKSKAVLSDATAIIDGAKTAITDGACDGTTTKPCNKTALADYLEDAKGAMGANDVVVRDGNKYTITYAGFSKLNEKYSENLFGSTTPGTEATQIDIAKVMDGGKVTTP